jgi:uncharacterized protein (DUF1778 family)
MIKAHKGGRTERIYLRVTPQEKTELLALAKAAGLSFSDWLVKTHLTQHAPDVAKVAAQKGVLHKNRSGKRAGVA